jgi:hypothetical protein
MNAKKSTIQNKLKSYSALAGTVAAAVSTSNAQVVYTDVAPDVTVNSGGMFNLDLNNDAVADFKILQQSGLYGGYFSYDAVGVYALQVNNAVDTAVGGFPAAFGSGVSVDATLSWLDSNQTVAISPPTANGLALVVPAFALYDGNFLGQNGKFLPLRFNVGASVYYGWVRLNVAGDAKSFTVIDYAYDAGGAPSITGVTTVGISEAARNNKVNVFGYNKNITVQIDPSVTAEGTIMISDVAGHHVSETVITNPEMVIPMDKVQEGIYLVTVKQTSGSYTKRIFVK